MRVALMVFLVSFVSVSSHAAPAVAFSSTSLSVSGVTAKGELVWLELTRERSDPWTERSVYRTGRAIDADGDGVITIDLGRPVPHRGIYFAFDLTSGESVSASPDPVAIGQMELDPAALRTLGGRKVWFARREQLVLFVARRGAGAWTKRFFEGAAGDEDGVEDGFMSAGFPALTPVGESGAFDRPLPGDLLLVADPRSMEFLTLTVAE